MTIDSENLHTTTKRENRKKCESMKKLSGIVALILAMAMLLTACGGTGTASVSSSQGTQGNNEPVSIGATETDIAEKTTAADTLVIGTYGYDIGSLTTGNPVNSIGCNLVYDTLFVKNYDTGEISPLLAESYEYIEDEDGLFLHITLRPEAHFASGDPVTAEDIQYRLEKYFAENRATSYLIGTIDMEHTYIDGDQDVYIALYNNDPSLLILLAHTWFVVGNKSWEETATEEDYWTSAVDGSGPYKVVEIVDGSHQLYQVNDDYWGWGIVDERPNFDYIKVVYYTESSTMMVDYENGALDMICGAGKSDTTRVLNEGLPHTNLRILPTGTYNTLQFGGYVDAFQDIRVRQAICYAIDVEAAVEASVGCLGSACTSYVSAIAQYRIDYGANEYNPEKAKELLAEAGYGDGSLTLTMVTENTNEIIALAEIIKGYLADVGINLELESYEKATALPLMRNGGCDMPIGEFYTMNGFTSGCFIQTGTTSYNQATLRQEEDVNEWLEKGRYAATEEEAEEAYTWLQNWYHDTQWILPLYDVNKSMISMDYVDASGIADMYQLRDLRTVRLVDEA